jgi:hypothetical protein
VDATQTSSGTWEADVPVTSGLAAQATTVVPVVTCPGTEVPAHAGEVPFHVDAFDTMRVTVSPTAAAVGDRVGFAMTGGPGSCWYGWVEDRRRTLWTLWLEGDYPGPDLHPVLTTDFATWARGSFVVPARMPVGDAELDIHCSQTVDRPVVLHVEAVPPASSADTATTVSGAVSTTATASSGADPAATTGVHAFGGGVPVVSGSPEPVDPRFPLPTLAPPVAAEEEASAAPQALASAPASSTSPGWALLGLLVVPALGALWVVQRRRRHGA